MKTSRNAVFQKLPLATGSSFVINRYQSPNFETPWHFHEEYELVYCEKGFGNKFIGDSFSTYQEGEIAFIGKNVPHLFKADDSFYQADASIKPSSIVIQFSEDFLGKEFFNSPEMASMKKILLLSMNGLVILGDTKEKIKQVMIEMLDLGNIGRFAKLIEIFTLLSIGQELQPISVNIISGININDSLKMNKVLEYTLLHFKDDISIAEVASLSNLSESAFCRYFKSRTQKSYLSFVIEMRLNESGRILRESNKSILEICYECGFKNLSNFNRLFRKQFNQNPMEYRKNSEQ
ncbi:MULTISPECIES: AraC family transcriptional regulator [unclassified Arcicella]|uniref:AraC family transcriptional regulator n=1 Tax=unclassified Arcicella TaxID=2644986 RepID=UPI002859660B|nr:MULTISPECIES: AraC family transcriptional regulator [unclassified Arcicella]MDR6562296.1 AraC-like DNA-binding protein [Arcicella sp. BE51]MDR6812009.1 AraC-like DNA-binding protein [Arcicella sp. BE140]MDR6823320.1 AraC-like DNA-binding protein [Arcicella sp. BE139]